MKHTVLLAALLAAPSLVADETETAAPSAVADLGSVTVEADALSRYRPEKVSGATFTDIAPEESPTVVDTLTEDFIRERNPTDLNDLLRWVPGIETGGTSLLVRQPGLFSVRGMGGSEPAFDGVFPVGRGSGLFMDPAVMERVEIVKGPIASLSGGAGAQQNNNGAGGSVNMYLKGATLERDRTVLQANTSVGRNTWRQRGSADVNEVVAEDRFAVRLVGAFDVWSPSYCGEGSQDGARPRQSYTAAPSILFKANDALTFGLKTLFTLADQPSYIGVPVWRGRPAGGYGWHESSCRRDDRSKYTGLMVNPYVDWQVTETWLLKFGGAFTYSDMEQTTREPYTESGEGLENFYVMGEWLGDEKYQTTTFSQSESHSRSFNLYTRSVWTEEELPDGWRNSLVVQPDFYYRESSGGFGTPTSRYGVTLQDAVGWGWVTLLGGLRYDYFDERATTVTTTARNGSKTVTLYPSAREFAFSPRGGLTVRPLDWLVLFGNLSQTKTPQLGLVSADGTRPTDPWTATQWEAGLRLRPVEKLWLSVSYYDIDQKNLPVADTDGYYHFEGENRSRGTEVSLSGDVTENWTVMAMYAYNFYTDETIAKGNPGRNFERMPRHAFTLNTSYRFSGGPLRDIVIGAGCRLRSRSYATMRGAYVNRNLRFNPSEVLDVNVAIPLSKFGGSENWVLTLGIRNLLDEHYFDTSRHYYECFAGEPRTFEIGIRASF